MRIELDLSMKIKSGDRLIKIMSKKVIITSKNPVKINAVKEGFKKMFPKEEFVVEGVSIPSGVADQPMSNEETMLGAKNRVNNTNIYLYFYNMYNNI